MVPGVQLRPNGTGMLVELQRGQGEINSASIGNYCPPMYFIDGVYYPLPPLQTQSVPVGPSEILGIEVYSNLFSAPPQFQRRGSGCGGQCRTRGSHNDLEAGALLRPRIGRMRPGGQRRHAVCDAVKISDQRCRR